MQGWLPLDGSTVAALFVDDRGPYAGLAGVELWDARADARRYVGPWPIVAHPPCGPWGNLRHLHVPGRNRLNDAACGPIAVAQVRLFGGVLEQPAGSKLWERCGIPKPGEPDDAWRGWSLQIDQCEWGHVARKRTWLYLAGVPRSAIEPPPLPGAEPTHWVSGGRKHDRKGSGGVVPPGIKVCSAQQRRRTPPLLADYLVRLARGASPIWTRLRPSEAG